MLVVLDANVIVSGLLKDTGYPSRIIDLVVGNQLQLAYDNRIMGEYEEVLSRPELAISPAKAGAVIAYIELAGRFIEIENALKAEEFADQKDMPFVEVFIASQAQALVTGNLRHFMPLIEKGLPVMAPAQFIEKFFPQQ